jgi:hypothetical protein
MLPSFGRELQHEMAASRRPVEARDHLAECDTEFAAMPGARQRFVIAAFR